MSNLTSAVDFAELNVTGNETCDMYRRRLLGEARPHMILSFLTPSDERLWDERDTTWNALYTVYSATFALLFLVVGIHAVMLIIRKDCVRMRTKTFFAVYLCIAILGFSRFLFLVLDPYGVIGFISSSFKEWIIVSRFLAAFGFPSLVASYTMVFLTLLKIADTTLQKRWYQKWKYVIPITLVPYVIAIGGELIAHAAPYPTLIAVTVCESLFTLWGVVISVTYIFAGFRLLRKIDSQQRRTVVRRSVVHPNVEAMNRRQAFMDEEYQRRKKGTQGTTRKIAIITNVTAVLGLLYSLASAASLILLSLFIFESCLGFLGRKGNSTAWLIMQVVLKSLEVVLSANMFYSITDMRALVMVVRHLVLCQCCPCNTSKDKEEGNSSSEVNATRPLRTNHSLASMSTSLANVADSRLDLTGNNLGGVHVQAQMDSAHAEASQTDSPPEDSSYVPPPQPAMAEDITTEEEESVVHVDVEGSIDEARTYVLNAHKDLETSSVADSLLSLSNREEASSPCLTIGERDAATLGHSDKAVQTEPKPKAHNKWHMVPHPLQHPQQHSSTQTNGVSRLLRKFTV